MPLAVQTFATAKDAESALQAAGTRYLGGGTLVLRALNEGDIAISNLVRVTDAALTKISISGGKVTLGASVTMAQIMHHPVLQPIARAAKAVGGPAIRNMATVGGNLFAPSPYGDFAVALLALDAAVSIAGHEMPIEDFLKGRAAHAGSIVASVGFVLPKAESFRFTKVSRVKPKGISVLSIAVTLEEHDGKISSARIALGAMADRPVRATAAEKALIGKARTREGIAAALAVIGDGVTPPTDAIASSWYRKEVLPVHFSRLLLG